MNLQLHSPDRRNLYFHVVAVPKLIYNNYHAPFHIHMYHDLVDIHNLLRGNVVWMVHIFLDTSLSFVVHACYY